MSSANLAAMVASGNSGPSNGVGGFLGLDLKWIALICLIVQNSGLALVMRYTMVVGSSEDRYLSSTAVLLAELLKLVFSVTLCYVFDCHSSLPTFLRTCYDEFLSPQNRGDWIKLTVPSLLYTLQNSLQYFSMSQLSAPVFQVLYQMKIVTTAVFSVVILSRRISGMQWLSIVALTGGVALVQLSQMQDTNAGSSTNSFLGFASVICGCLTSGFAGVYFEMVLKQSAASIWIRNIQLSAIGIIISSIACFVKDETALLEKGFFVGYNKAVIGVILLQAAGGLIVAVVVKYADNVLKGFSTSLSILLSCVISDYMFHDLNVTLAFVVGAAIVLVSVFLFGYQPQAPIVASPSKQLGV